MKKLMLCAFFLAGCGKQAPPPAAPPPAPAQEEAATELDNEVAAVQVASPAEVASFKLALDSDGLRLFNTVSGSARPLPFGAERADLVKQVSLTQKAQPVEQGDVSDCNASYARWKNGMTVWFADGRFSGWSVGAGSDGVATAAGVRPGSTRKELEAVHVVDASRTTLGIEFTAGRISGLLDGEGPEARITSLWAGTTCLMR